MTKGRGLVVRVRQRVRREDETVEQSWEDSRQPITRRIAHGLKLARARQTRGRRNFLFTLQQHLGLMGPHRTAIKRIELIFCIDITTGPRGGSINGCATNFSARGSDGQKIDWINIWDTKNVRSWWMPRRILAIPPFFLSLKKFPTPVLLLSA